MDKTPARNDRQSTERQLLLQVGILVKPLAARCWRILGVFKRCGFIFDAISEGRVRRDSVRSALRVISLIFESHVVDVVVEEGGKVVGISLGAVVGIAIKVIGCGEAMLPAGGSCDVEFNTSK